MPTKKTAKASTKKAKGSEEVPKPQDTESKDLKDDPEPKNEKTEKPAVQNVASEKKEPGGDGQLFFSTDGSEPEKAEVNPFDKEDKATGGAEQTDKLEDSKSVQGNAESENPPNHKNQHNRQHSQPKHNHPNQQGQGNKNFKKQNWQDKKRQKNKPRPKFKRPRKLPFEDTESKPLELGNLLELDTLKTEEGISSLAEIYAASDLSPIKYNDLYTLDLPELKQRIGELPLDIELPPAPVTFC
jgi:hypothetical protein